MYNFTFHRPTGLRQASNMLGKLEEPKILAGGQTLIPTMKLRLASPGNIVDLNAIEGELSGIELKGRSIVIGAMTRHVEVANSAVVKENLPALAYLAGLVGDPAVRHRGTIGGSISNADPAADYPAGLVGHGATVVTNKRKIAADDFFTGLFETALETGEIVTSVRFPVPTWSAYQKLRHPASGYAVVGVLVAQTKSGVRVAVTGAGPSVFRVAKMEEALTRDFSAKAIEGITIPADEMNNDIHASAAYRAHVVTVLAKRAVAAR